MSIASAKIKDGLRSLAFLVLLGSALSSISCSERPSQQNPEELSDIRSELRSLKQLKSDVESLQKEVSELKNKTTVSTAQRAVTDINMTLDDTYLDDPFMGDPNAVVVVMAFTNYQCTPCRRFFSDTFQHLKEQYIDSNKIKFILRDFPLSSNSSAEQAAEFAQCAGEQGLYWEAYRVLLEKTLDVDQGKFTDLFPLIPEANEAKFNKCFSSRRYQNEIQSDFEDAKRLGAGGAPGFLVARFERKQARGYFVRGAQPFELFKYYIDLLLNQSIEEIESGV